MIHCTCQACGYHHDIEINRIRQFAALEEIPALRRTAGDRCLSETAAQRGREPLTTTPDGKRHPPKAEIPKYASPGETFVPKSWKSTYNADYVRKEPVPMQPRDCVKDVYAPLKSGVGLGMPRYDINTMYEPGSKNPFDDYVRKEPVPMQPRDVYATLKSGVGLGMPRYDINTMYEPGSKNPFDDYVRKEPVPTSMRDGGKDVYVPLKSGVVLEMPWCEFRAMCESGLKRPFVVRRAGETAAVVKDPLTGKTHIGTETRKKKGPYVDVKGWSEVHDSHYYPMAHDISHYDGTRHNSCFHPGPYHADLSRPKREVVDPLKWAGDSPRMKTNLGLGYDGSSTKPEPKPDDDRKRSMLKQNAQPKYGYANGWQTHKPRDDQIHLNFAHRGPRLGDEH